jgi:uncharacterized small protein (TIGR04563 family)
VAGGLLVGTRYCYPGPRPPRSLPFRRRISAGTLLCECTTAACFPERLRERILSEMSGTDRRKQSLYFGEAMLDEIKSEAARLDRSLSWVVQKAWEFARGQVTAMPSANAAPEPTPATRVGDDPIEGESRTLPSAK